MENLNLFDFITNIVSNAMGIPRDDIFSSKSSTDIYWARSIITKNASSVGFNDSQISRRLSVQPSTVSNLLRSYDTLFNDNMAFCDFAISVEKQIIIEKQNRENEK